ncbi:uncharacterized protein K452DRAFT_333652 [Aplosporella prunicola CBS 121167]|uniref:BTB domain-containing protein n=1 Tax=Aplosporella prunicola CBS 121167 TaxID=1176127 RepID=A0A6A6BEP8_9PEZI|nr:uncharacterized protein K452DRAFT_333652 [Aplosporella prunicola CBS 121167]KAF2141863.1 hypothetical protein K452DRAFT_333652 [Aplosporella prunicola CBS 121167]
MRDVSLFNLTSSERRALLKGNKITICLEMSGREIFTAGDYPKLLMLSVSDIGKFGNDTGYGTFTLPRGSASSSSLVRVLRYLVSSCRFHLPITVPLSGDIWNDVITYQTTISLGLKDFECSLGNDLITLIHSRQPTSQEFRAFFKVLPADNRVINSLVHVTAWRRRHGRLADEGIKAYIESHPYLLQRFKCIDVVVAWKECLDV